MIIRPDQLKIDPGKPFGQDRLHRLESAEILTDIIENADSPFVLALDSKWGNGKTTFIKMWQAQLAKDGYCCLYFNAWETDFAKDALVSLVGEIETQLVWEAIPEEHRNKVQKYWEEAKVALSGVFRKSGTGCRETCYCWCN